MHHRDSGRQPPYVQYRCELSRSDMDEELASENQRIDDMSFKDLTARAAAALKPKPANTPTTPAKETEPKASGKDAPAKSKTS